MRLGSTAQCPEVGQLVLKHLCPAIHAILLDGLKPHIRSLFGRMRNSVWKVVEDSAEPGTFIHCLVGNLVNITRSKQVETSLNFNQGWPCFWPQIRFICIYLIFFISFDLLLYHNISIIQEQKYYCYQNKIFMKYCGYFHFWDRISIFWLRVWFIFFRPWELCFWDYIGWKVIGYNLKDTVIKWRKVIWYNITTWL